jgi:hypothetical protein
MRRKWPIRGVPYLATKFLWAPPRGASRQLWVLAIFQILWMILLAAIVGVIVYSVIRQRRRPADYGFSWKAGGAVSLALVAVLHVYFVVSGKLVPSAVEGFGGLSGAH